MNSENNKVMTIKEAVSKFVKDGDMLNPCNFVYAIPFAIVHEIIRQRKKNLTLASNAFIEEGDLLIGGECVSKIITAYSHRGGGRRYKNELDRALRAKTVEIEDYSNFTMVSMFKAGALGYTYMPVMNAIKETDIFRIRTIMGENKFKIIKCPFTGKESVVVPALNPDVGILHVQRADKYGNAQFWGSLGTLKWGALSCKKLIVSCEEIVDHEKIKRSPFLTVVPGFRVNAVCEEPWGAHPSELAGYYDVDNGFRAFYFAQTLSKLANQKWMQEWIYDRKDRKDYLDHYIERFSKKPLERCKVNEYLSDQINMGYKKKYWQNDFCHKIAQTREEYLEKVEKYGELEL
ncbi:MAG: CoA transferase subunit A [Promethearchaeota archaeon]|nr:MAG: CoA transferase subunit A [Candidatus Lokiarchaeota archaeon]